MKCLSDIWTVLAILSTLFLAGASYWAGVNHGWEKHKKLVKYIIKDQENWETLA